jgi:GTP cyclohydrolase II
MTAALADLAASLDRAAEVDTDRAVAELRAGRPVVISSGAGHMIVAALDGVAPRLFAALAALPGALLGLPAERTHHLGLAGDAPICIPLEGLNFSAAMHLATAPDADEPASHLPAHPAIEAGIALCKRGLLLPSVLAVPVQDIAGLPDQVYRVRLDRLICEDSVDAAKLTIVSEAEVPLSGNIPSRFVVFRGGPAPRDQVAVIVGNPSPEGPVPVRLHSACLTGDLFGSLRCDCGDQLRSAIERLAAQGGGVLLYLDQEGRGIGIGNKMRSYALQDQGFDTIEADRVLGFGADGRRYACAAGMLAALGHRRIILLTNNPGKIDALRRHGIEVVARQPLTGAVTPQNLRYLHTKARRADHMLHELLGLAPASTPPGSEAAPNGRDPSPP